MRGLVRDREFKGDKQIRRTRVDRQKTSESMANERPGRLRGNRWTANRSLDEGRSLKTSRRIDKLSANPPLIERLCRPMVIEMWDISARWRTPRAARHGGVGYDVVQPPRRLKFRRSNDSLAR
jgi:hypothetical protein